MSPHNEGCLPPDASLASPLAVARCALTASPAVQAIQLALTQDHSVSMCVVLLSKSSGKRIVSASPQDLEVTIPHHRDDHPPQANLYPSPGKASRKDATFGKQR